MHHNAKVFRIPLKGIYRLYVKLKCIFQKSAGIMIFFKLNTLDGIISRLYDIQNS